MLGHARDDARWSTTVAQKGNAVVVSVNYRLAPKHPFPTGQEDCVDAVLWLWEHAEELGIDTSKTALSGFSAGGNFCFTVALRLRQELLRRKQSKTLSGGLERGKIVALASFYGMLDATVSPEEKERSNPKLIPVMPAKIWEMIYESYMDGNLDMAQPLVSPGLATDEELEGLPERIVLVVCEGDTLLAENERMRDRLEGLGKRITWHLVECVGHGWDKSPSWKKGNVKRDEAYGVAVEGLRRLGLEYLKQQLD